MLVNNILLVLGGFLIMPVLIEIIKGWWSYRATKNKDIVIKHYTQTGILERETKLYADPNKPMATTRYL